MVMSESTMVAWLGLPLSRSNAGVVESMVCARLLVWGMVGEEGVGAFTISSLMRRGMLVLVWCQQVCGVRELSSHVKAGWEGATARQAFTWESEEGVRSEAGASILGPWGAGETNAQVT